MALRTAGGQSIADGAQAERLRDLARRCRDLAELTAVPEVVRELERIARALDDEAGVREGE
jgi:hypothetical protein